MRSKTARRHVGDAFRVSILLAAAFGCRGRDTREPVKSTSAAVSRQNRVATTARDGGTAALRPEQIARYRQGMQTGRRSAHKGQWADSVRAFDDALRAIPNDARALSELGWALFQVGDRQRALQTTQRALSVAVTPALKAAAFYNLGRLAEAEGRAQQAASHYSNSLMQRPSKAAETRLAALAPSDAGAATAQVRGSRCADPMPRQKLCMCLAQLEEDYDPDSQSEPECTSDTTFKTSPFEILVVSRDILNHSVYLIASADKNVRVVTPIGRFWDGGVGNVYNEWRIAKFERRTVGPANVLWIETEFEGHDADYGVDEEESYETRALTVCVVRSPSGNALRCPIHVPLHYESERSVVSADDNSFLDADERKKLRHDGLPRRDEGSVEVSLAAEGTAEVRLVHGTASPEMKAQLGIHRLW